MGKLLSRNKPPEDEKHFSYDFPVFPPAPVSERQDTATSDRSTLLTVGAAFFLANVFLGIALLLDKPKLENDHMCGIPTGGKVRNKE